MTPEDDIPEITPAMWARAAPRAAWEQARALVKAWVEEDGSNFIVLEERIAVVLRERDEARQLQQGAEYNEGLVMAELEQVKRERDEAQVALRALVESYDSCDSHRGAFSCVAAHDVRCLKARGKPEAECGCGRDELDAALDRARTVLGEEEKP